MLRKNNRNAQFGHWPARQYHRPHRDPKVNVYISFCCQTQSRVAQISTWERNHEGQQCLIGSQITTMIIHHRCQNNFVVSPKCVFLRRLPWSTNNKIIDIHSHIGLQINI